MKTKDELLFAAGEVCGEVMKKHPSRVDCAYILLIAAGVMSVEARCDDDRSVETLREVMQMRRKRYEENGGFGKT